MVPPYGPGNNPAPLLISWLVDRNVGSATTVVNIHSRTNACTSGGPARVARFRNVGAYVWRVASERLRVSGSCVIGLDELEWRFSGSGGPGGQHANTANTRVELRFDVRGSGSLGPRQRARIIERLGPVVRVVASDSRSQHRNRELALERLRERLADALRIERTRVPTRVSRSAKEKRLSEKRRRSDRKRTRARPTGDE